MRFQVGICSENFQLGQIQNGQLSAMINFNMPDYDISQTVPDNLHNWHNLENHDDKSSLYTSLTFLIQEITQFQLF